MTITQYPPLSRKDLALVTFGHHNENMTSKINLFGKDNNNYYSVVSIELFSFLASYQVVS